MDKKIFIVFLAFILLFSACARSTAALPSATSAAVKPAASPTPFKVNDSQQVAATPTQLSLEAAGPNPGCTVKSDGSLPEADPTQKAVYASKDYDWAKGPQNAPVTIIEYSDFQ